GNRAPGLRLADVRRRRARLQGAGTPGHQHGDRALLSQGAEIRAPGPATADSLGAVADHHGRLGADRDQHAHGDSRGGHADRRLQRRRPVLGGGDGPDGGPGSVRGLAHPRDARKCGGVPHLGGQRGGYLTMDVLIFVGTLLGFMAFGMPIAFALILGAIGLMFHLSFFDPQIIVQNMLTGADNFSLMAVPVVLLAGGNMDGGGMSRRMGFMDTAVGRPLKGGVGYVGLLARNLVAGLAGAAGADAAGLGGVPGAMLRKQ